jgi:hypothetical protein
VARKAGTQNHLPSAWQADNPGNLPRGVCLTAEHGHDPGMRPDLCEVLFSAHRSIHLED